MKISASEKKSPNDDKKSPEKTPTVPNLCIECSKPCIGSSWGYMHAGTIHSPVCTSCMNKNQYTMNFPVQDLIWQKWVFWKMQCGHLNSCIQVVSKRPAR